MSVAIDVKDGADLRAIADATAKDVRVIVATILGVAAITVARIIADALKDPGKKA